MKPDEERAWERLIEKLGNLTELDTDGEDLELAKALFEKHGTTGTFEASLEAAGGAISDDPLARAHAFHWGAEVLYFLSASSGKDHELLMKRIGFLAFKFRALAQAELERHLAADTSTPEPTASPN